MEIKETLKMRRALKKKKPDFIRQDAHKKARVSSKWRRSKGVNSKMRLRKKGYRRSITVGWKSPQVVRGLTQEGKKPVIVHTVEELTSVDDGCIAVIGSSVGTKKRLEIAKIAQEKNIIILNMKDASAYVKKVDEDMQKRLENKKKAEAAKKAKQKDKEKKAQEKEAKKDEEKKGEEKAEKSDDELADKIKKEEEKKEKDKLLTKRTE
jgi:large subunit ribosomal protein L32e